jgi:hypothetical protein
MYYKEPKENEPDLYHVYGKISRATTGSGKGWTSTYPGTGEYSIVFRDTYYSYVFAEAHVVANTSEPAAVATVVAINPSSGTATIKTFADDANATADALTADSGLSVCFHFVFKKTSV